MTHIRDSRLCDGDRDRPPNASAVPDANVEDSLPLGTVTSLCEDPCFELDRLIPGALGARQRSSNVGRPAHPRNTVEAGPAIPRAHSPTSRCRRLSWSVADGDTLMALLLRPVRQWKPASGAALVDGARLGFRERRRHPKFNTGIAFPHGARCVGERLGEDPRGSGAMFAGANSLCHYPAACWKLAADGQRIQDEPAVPVRIAGPSGAEAPRSSMPSAAGRSGRLSADAPPLLLPRPRLRGADLLDQAGHRTRLRTGADRPMWRYPVVEARSHVMGSC